MTQIAEVPEEKERSYCQGIEVFSHDIKMIMGKLRLIKL